MDNIRNPYRDLQALFLPPLDFIEQGAGDEEWDANLAIYGAVKLAIQGDISLDDALDIIEQNVLYNDMDRYLDEVERDLGIWWQNWNQNGMIVLPNNCVSIQLEG